jgi:hypothetical protein
MHTSHAFGSRAIHPSHVYDSRAEYRNSARGVRFTKRFSGRVKSGGVRLQQSFPTIERTRDPHRNPAGQIRASKMWAV